MKIALVRASEKEKITDGRRQPRAEDNGGDSACPPAPPLLLKRDRDVLPVRECYRI
jgi:hypothetical protein